MKEFFKYLYKVFKSCYLRNKGVLVSPHAFFNQRTEFEGTNVIHRGTCISGSIIGYGTYIGENSFFPNCQIGRFCSIASNIKVVVPTHPTSTFVSTSPMFFSPLKQNGKTFCKKSKFKEFLTVDNRYVIIGNDVWIGEGVTIKGGVRIGDGAIVAMNACVTKDVPPYAIVGGMPAKIIRYRFTDEQIRFLLDFQWWNKPIDWIQLHADEFENISDFTNKHIK